MRPLRLIQTIILAIIGILCLTIPAKGQIQTPDRAAVDVVTSWNKAVSTIEVEDQNFRELLDSYKRTPPGRALRRLAKGEEALQ